MKSPAPKFVALFPLLGLLAVVGCGSEGDTSAPAGVPSAPAGSPTEEVEAANEEAASESECSLPDGLLEQLNVDRQLVLGLAQSEGGSLEAAEAMGMPEPATFRSVADVLDDLDLSGVEPNSAFDEPDDVIQDLRQTADLLEAALAADSEGPDPAWTELGELYTQELFVRNNASIGYYLDEAGCT